MGFDFTQFEFDAEKRRQLGYKLVDRINQYFSSLDDRAVQLPLEQRSFGELHNQMPEIGESAEAVLDGVCRELIEKGLQVPSAKYFGLLSCSPTYMAVLDSL